MPIIMLFIALFNAICIALVYFIYIFCPSHFHCYSYKCFLFSLLIFQLFAHSLFISCYFASCTVLVGFLNFMITVFLSMKRYVLSGEIALKITIIIIIIIKASAQK